MSKMTEITSLRKTTVRVSQGRIVGRKAAVVRIGRKSRDRETIVRACVNRVPRLKPCSPYDAGTESCERPGR